MILAIGYLIGSIPFGVLAAKVKGVDIFKIGSGSMGTTNVIRACGLGYGIAVLILDILKGYFSVLIALTYLTNEWLIVLTGLFAMIGHSRSIFIRFRGGKSAATGTGILLALNWQIFLIVALIVLFFRQTSGYQSVASLVGSFFAPVLFWLYKEPQAYTIVVALGAAFVWIKHIPNIKRLLSGQEGKITTKKVK